MPNDKKKNTTSSKSKVKKFKETLAINREKQKLINEWIKVMTHSKTYNRHMDTFEIIEETMTMYGWSFKLLCPWGLTFESLKTLKSTIQDNLRCHFVYEVAESNSYAMCDIIYEDKIRVNSIPFEPKKVKPWQFYLGVKINNKPIIADVNTHPFIFIAGATRRGKNGALNHGLISLIHSCTSEQVRILYYQGAKGDGWIYKNCEQVYAWAIKDLNKLLEMCLYCQEQMKIRTKMFESMYTQFKGDNILSYNKLNKHNQMPYIYLIIDEFLAVNPDKTDSKEIKTLKNKIMFILNEMAQYGGALGVTYVVCHQKPEKDLCPTFLKNMSNTRVCFGFEDEVCSRIVLGNDLATNLPPRRAYILTEGKFELLFTTNLTGKMEEYLKPKYKNNRRDLFNDLKKVQKFSHTVEVKSTNSDNSKGKEDIKQQNEQKEKEEQFKQREFMLKEKEEIIKQKEEELKKLEIQMKLMKSKYDNKIHDLKYNYDMVNPNKDILEKNIENIPGFVPYEPVGKEKIK
jgi:DNA segregation ATPase FtsK/SpoIIIE and related proteins